MAASPVSWTDDDADFGVAVDRRSSQHAAVAVALAPVLLLAALTLVIGDVIEAPVGIAAVLGCIAWLVHAMHRYQRALGRAEDDFPPTAPDLPYLRELSSEGGGV